MIIFENLFNEGKATVLESEYTQTTLDLEIRILEKEVPVKIKILDASKAHFGADDAYFTLLLSPFQNQSQVSRIKLGGVEKNTLGFLFPIIALDDEHDGILEHYTSIFAKVAVKCLFSNSIDLRYVRRRSIDDSREINLSELFVPNTAILILDKKQLNQLQTTGENVLTMLLFNGYGAIPEEELFSSPALPPYASNIILCACSEPLKDIQKSARIFVAASRQEKNPAVRFVLLYQLIELLLDKAFRAEIEELRHNDTNWRNTSAVKNIIQTRILNETNRLNRIYADYIDKKDVDEPFREFTARCQIYLQNYGAGENVKQWSDATYAIRNRIMHSMHTISPSEALSLSEICDLFEQTLGVTLARFRFPT